MMLSLVALNQALCVQDAGSFSCRHARRRGEAQHLHTEGNITNARFQYTKHLQSVNRESERREDSSKPICAQTETRVHSVNCIKLECDDLAATVLQPVDKAAEEAGQSVLTVCCVVICTCPKLVYQVLQILSLSLLSKYIYIFC